MDDDYGVVEAHAEFALKDDDAGRRGRASAVQARRNSRSTLPQARTRAGAAQTTRDLTEHPWAGAEGRQ